MVNRCIYCLSKTEKFSSLEHIIPESLGNGVLILPIGYVCDRCNQGILAKLDDYLIKFEPIKFLQIFFVEKTKAGKFPIANFQNLRIEKTSPNNLRLTPMDKSGEIGNKTELGDGWFSFQIQMRGKIFNPIEIGRSLYKIGLGMVAYIKGNDFASDSIFNSARDYIFNRCGFENNMLMRLTAKPIPKPQFSVHEMGKGFFIYLNFYGFWIIINLMTEPKVKNNDKLIELGFKEYTLAK